MKRGQACIAGAWFRSIGRESAWRVASILFAAVAILAAHAPRATAGPCETGIAYDYSQPFEAMPSLPALPPRSGLPFGSAPPQLPFGPRGVYVGLRGVTSLMLTDDLPQRPKVGYWLSIPRGDKFANPALPEIDWLVTARVARVNRLGAVVEQLGSVRRRVRGASTDGIPLAMPLAVKLGLYRLEIVFRDGASKRLGRFGEYFRVIDPITDVRLTLEAPSYRPGETVSACLENYGTTAATYGACGLGIQFFDGSGWVQPPGSVPEPCPAIAYWLSAGQAKRLFGAIPKDAPPGRHRAIQSNATAEFQVLPSS